MKIIGICDVYPYFSSRSHIYSRLDSRICCCINNNNYQKKNGLPSFRKIRWSATYRKLSERSITIKRLGNTGLKF